LPIFLALLAVCSFGVSAPLAKLLLGEINTILLAALLYIGSGFGVLVIKVLQGVGGVSKDSEARISQADFIWLAGATVAGGIRTHNLLTPSPWGIRRQIKLTSPRRDTCPLQGIRTRNLLTASPHWGFEVRELKRRPRQDSLVPGTGKPTTC